MPDINQTFEMLRVNSKPKVVRAELDDMYTPTSNSLRYAVQGIDKMQERAMRAIDSRNQLAAQMAQLNGLEGADADNLQKIIQEHLDAIDSKVAEDGHWVYADKTVSKVATDFAVNNNVKKIMNAKAGCDTYIQSLENDSDADPTFKKMAIAKTLREWNAAGGALGNNGDNQFSNFAFNLGKYHDLKEIREEILKTFDKMKANGQYLKSEEFKQHAIQIMNDPNQSDEIKANVGKVYDAVINGYGWTDLHRFGISEATMMTIAQSIVSGNSALHQASINEATLLLDSAKQQGANIATIYGKQLYTEAIQNTNLYQDLISQTTSYETADVATQRAMLTGKLPISQSEIENVIANKISNMTDNELDINYKESYAKNKINSLFNYAGGLAFSDEDGKYHAEWWERLVTEVTRKSKEQQDALKLSWVNAYSTSSAIPTAETTEAQNELYRTNKQAKADLRSNIELLKQNPEANKAKIAVLQQRLDDINTNSDMFDYRYETLFNSQDINTKKEVFRNMAFDLFKVNSGIVETPIFKDIIEKEVNNIITSNIDENYNYDAFYNNINKIYDCIRKRIPTIYKMADKQSFLDKIQNEYYSMLSEKLSDKNINISARNLHVISEYDLNSNNNITQFEKGLDNIVKDNKGSWNIAAHFISNSHGNKLTEVPNYNGVPLQSNDDLNSLFATAVKTVDGKIVYAPSEAKYDYVVDEEGRNLVRMIIPVQGMNQVYQTVYLEANDRKLDSVLNDYASHIYINASNYVRENPYTSESAQQVITTMHTNLGANIPLTGDPFNETEASMTDMIRGNNIKGNMYFTLGSGLNAIIASPCVTDSDKYTLFAGGCKLGIEKHKNDTYDVTIEYLTKEGIVKEYIPTYRNSIDFKNDIQQFMNNGRYSKLIQDNQYLTSFQKLLLKNKVQ